MTFCVLLAVLAAAAPHTFAATPQGAALAAMYADPMKHGAVGGDSLYRKRNGRWHLVEDGGGAMGVDYMRKFGVPQSDWCTLSIFDAKCR